MSTDGEGTGEGTTGLEGVVQKLKEAQAKEKLLDNDELRENLALISDLEKQITSLVKSLNDMGNTQTDVNSILKDYNDQVTKYGKEMVVTSKSYKDQIESLNKLAEVQTKLSAAEKKRAADAKELGISLEELKKLQDEVGESSSEMGSIIENAFRNSRGVLGGLISDGIKFKKMLGEMVPALNELMGKDMSNLEGFEPILRKITDFPAFGTGKKLGVVLGEAMGKFAAAKFSAIISVALGGFVFAKFIGTALQLDKVSKQLASAGGSARFFAHELYNIREAGLRANIQLEDASKAVAALRDNFSAFRAGKSHHSLALTVAGLEKLGVDGGTSSKVMDHFNRVMGKTGVELEQTTIKIAMMGRAMGSTSAKMMADFAGVADQLAIFGDRSLEVFGDLAAQAKASGMQVGELVKLAEGFNTFDSAADKAAQLNAVLGTQISMLDVMNMSYEDRINYLREEVKYALGGNLADMDMYTQMYVQQALGVSSVAAAQKMLNMDQDQYNEHLKEQEAAAKSQEELLKTAQEMVPVMTKMLNAFQKTLTIFEPGILLFLDMLNLIGGAFGLIFWGLEKSEKGAAWLGPFATKAYDFAAIIVKIAATAALLAGAFMAIANPLGLAVTFLGAFAKVASVLVGSAFVNWLIGLHNATTDPGSPPLYEVFGVIAEGIKFLVSVLNPAGLVIDKITGTFRSLHAAVTGIFGGDNDPSDSMLASLADFDGNKLAAGLSSAKTSLKEIGAISGKSGFLTMKSDGPKTEVMMASDNVLASAFGGKLTVDVKMPEQGKINNSVKVFIDGDALRDAVARIIEDS